MKTNLLVYTPFSSTCLARSILPNTSNGFNQTAPLWELLQIGKYATTISDADMSRFRTHKQRGWNLKESMCGIQWDSSSFWDWCLWNLGNMPLRRMFGPVSLRIPKPPQKHQLSFDCLSKEFKALQYVAVVVLRASSLRVGNSICVYVNMYKRAYVCIQYTVYICIVCTFYIV